MDKITIQRMQCYGFHGVFPEERKLGQRFYVDLTLYLNLRRAGVDDDLQQTINYAEVCSITRKIVEDESYLLIEAVAERIASALLATYTKLNEIDVRVIKPNPPFDTHVDGVAVEIRRKREV